jgi:predicted GNAT family acetyltransferase
VIEVRRVGPDDWRAFRDVRLRALADAPDAFITTHAEASAQPDQHWQDRTTHMATSDDAAMFLACDGTSVIGLAGCFVDDNGDRMVISVWRDPAYRGRGVGAAVTDAAARFVEATGHQPVLWVMEHNELARRSYERLGFVATGVRAQPPERPGVWEIEMRRATAPSSPAS